MAERILVPLLLDTIVVRVVILHDHIGVLDRRVDGFFLVSSRLSASVGKTLRRSATTRRDSSSLFAPSLSSFVEDVGDNYVGTRRVPAPRQALAPWVLASGDAGERLSPSGGRASAWLVEVVRPSITPRPTSATKRDGHLTRNQRNLVPLAAPFSGPLVRDMPRALFGVVARGRLLTVSPLAAPFTAPHTLTECPVMLIPRSGRLLVLRPTSPRESEFLGRREHSQRNADGPRHQGRATKVILQPASLLGSRLRM